MHQNLEEDKKEFISNSVKEINEVRENSGLKIPVSLILSQMIVESGWGTSHYFNAFNNPLGIYTFKGGKRKIKRYSSLKESIIDYFQIMGKLSYYSQVLNLSNNGKSSIYIVRSNSLKEYSENPNYGKFLEIVLTKYSLHIFDT